MNERGAYYKNIRILQGCLLEPASVMYEAGGLSNG